MSIPSVLGKRHREWPTSHELPCVDGSATATKGPFLTHKRPRLPDSASDARSTDALAADGPVFDATNTPSAHAVPLALEAPCRAGEPRLMSSCDDEASLVENGPRVVLSVDKALLTRLCAPEPALAAGAPSQSLALIPYQGPSPFSQLASGGRLNSYPAYARGAHGARMEVD